MARGAYKETAAVRGLRELVEFAQGDRGDPLAVAKMGLGIVMVPASNRLRALSQKQIQSLRQDVNAFLRDVAGHPLKNYSLLKEATIRPELVPLLGRLRQDRQLFGVNGSPRDVLLYQVATLLYAIGEERLRFCPAPDCERLFVKVGRREYCSERCQRRVFVSKYDPFKAQPRRKDRYGENKKTR